MLRHVGNFRVARHKQRILGVARGVVGGRVQGVEAVPFGFEVGGFGYGESGALKNVAYFADCCRKGVDCPAANFVRGQGDVRLGAERLYHFGIFEARVGLGYKRLYLRLRKVYKLSDNRPLRFVERGNDFH